MFVRQQHRIERDYIVCDAFARTRNGRQRLELGKFGEPVLAPRQLRVCVED